MYSWNCFSAIIGLDDGPVLPEMQVKGILIVGSTNYQEWFFIESGLNSCVLPVLTRRHIMMLSEYPAKMR